MIGCDVTDCTVVALAVLAFRDTPGHVHVCHTHERIDREHADVVRSTRVGAFTGCPWCPGGKPGRAILGSRIPPLLPISDPSNRKGPRP